MVRSAILLLTMLLAGCYGSGGRPTPLPGELGQVVSALVLRGATITDQISGDPGCSIADLRNNAIRYEVRMPGETDPASVYVLNWYRPADFDAGAQAFADCVAQHEAARPGTAAVTVSSPPWRAYGTAWSDALQVAVTEALTSVR